MLFIILWIGPIFRTLPRAVLSCIVVVNLRSMFLQFKQLPRADFIKKNAKNFQSGHHKVLNEKNLQNIFGRKIRDILSFRDVLSTFFVSVQLNCHGCVL